MINPVEFGEKFSEKLNKLTTEQQIAYLKELGFAISAKPRSAVRSTKTSAMIKKKSTGQRLYQNK